MTQTPLAQAEQAVLGAVLLEPRQIRRLSGWLRPEHFRSPAHAALYTAMLKLHADEHPATTAPPDTPTPLTWVNDTQAEASSHTRGLTAAYVHSLALACPRPAHAPVYGRMVLEGAIHRSVTEHAVRLLQAARTDAARGTGVTETLHHAQVLDDVLDDLTHRWGGGGRPASTTTPPPTSARASETADARVRDDEELLLGALATHPQQMGDVADWLSPEDFTDPGHRHIFHALKALHHRGEPIDQLTVLWECQRRGILADGTLDADRVRQVCDSPPGGAASYFGEQVLDASLLRAAAASARHVRHLAANDAVAPGQLISQATAALLPLDEVRRRRAAADAVPEPETATAKPSGTPPPARAAAARARSPTPHARTATPPALPLRPVPVGRQPRRSPS